MHRQSPLARKLAQVLWWIALACFAGALIALLIRTGPVVSTWLAGIGLVLLGVNILLGGEVIAGPMPRLFIARGQVVRGVLEAHCGPADLNLGDCPGDRVAVVRSGPMGRPFYEAQDGMAVLRISQPPLPNPTAWQAGLAGNVLWDIDAQAGIGNLALNLTDLRLETVNARTGPGRLTVLCPARGYTRLALRSGSGDIEVVIPEGIGAKIEVSKGRLGTLRIRNARLIDQGGGRCTTSGYSSSAAQVEISIQTWAGEITLS
ncbi:MAG: hypothetical protein IT326_03690 [Anaerolineae bacterium]|nr:hypothetical protein [Anaerolineae bacterium]